MCNVKKEVLSITLLFCFIFSIFTNSVYAVGDIESAVFDSSDQMLATPEQLVLSSEDVPEVINFSDAQEKGHILRLREKEPDDNTVIFLNNNNTETMYIFAEPIKYTDEYGNKKDKSTELTLSDGVFEMTQNDINVSFATNISKGISISREDIEITMTPIFTATNENGNHSIDATETVGIMENNRMTYTNVFDSATLVYTPLYSGFKEDIVLDSYNGTNEFSFVVNTNGLIPIKQDNGSVWFYEISADVPSAKMMQVVCYDANNRFADGDVTINELKPGGLYVFTISADVAFLTDENTAYPVSVDPTITLNTESAIEDAVVYSGKPDRNYGDYKYSTVGYLDSSYGTGRLFIGFPTLHTNSVFQTLDETLIENAKFSIYTASSKSGTTFDVYRYDQGIWAESTITWNNIVYYTTPLKINTTPISAPSGGSKKTEFDITSAVQTWASVHAMATPDRGIIIMSPSPNNSSASRDFLNVEYATSSSSRAAYMPTLEISYESVIEIYTSVPKTNIKVGEKTSISAYITVDGEPMYNNGTLMSFCFLNNDGTLSSDLVSSNGVLGLNSTLGGQVQGLKQGSAVVRVSCPSYTDKYVDITISVTATISGASTYTINCDSGYSNVRTRSCQIEATLGQLEVNEGLTFTIIQENLEYGGYDVSSQIGTGIDITTVNNKKKVKFTIEIPQSMMPQNEYHTYPTGSVKIKISGGGATKTITVKITCNPIAPSTSNYIAGINRTGGRYLAIPFPEQSGYDNSSELAQMLESRDLNCEGLIRENYSFYDNLPLWYAYEGSDAKTKIFLEYMRHSKVVCVLSHGTATGIALNSSNSNAQLTAEQIYKLRDGYFDYCQLVIYSTCASGSTMHDNDTYNIMYATKEKGAHAVMGYTRSVLTGQANIFEYVFLSCLRTDGSYQWNSGHFRDPEYYIWENDSSIKEAFDRAYELNIPQNSWASDAADVAVLIYEDESEHIQ